MNIFKSLFFVILLLLCLFSCISDEESFYQEKYKSEDLVKLHGEDFKLWELQAFYDNYEQKVLSERNACFIDDVYVFKKDSKEIQVTAGEVGCSKVNSKDETTTASYEFYEDEGLVFISISKASEVNGVIKNNFFSLQLVELSASQMIFAAGEKGNYGMALVFVTG
ncbi:hypothetical protein [Algoriphagus sp.]|uniref:hypothetical protein n=1 Tax=Algoriphagus sp. TaxID=1872435 RepID=UPI0032734B26